MNVGEALQAARRRLGLSQSELALRVGMREESISRIERGTARPRPETLARLAEGLGVPVEYWVNPAVVQDVFARLGDLSRCFMSLGLRDQVLLLEICARLSLPVRDEASAA